MAEQGVSVVLDQVAELFAAFPDLVQVDGADSLGAAGDLHDGAAQRLAWIDGGVKPQRAFAADGGGFNGFAGAHHRHQRDDAVAWKIDHVYRVAGLVKQSSLF